MTAAANLAPIDNDFDFVRSLVRERSGIVLESSKSYLAEARLLPVAKREGLTGGVAELVGKLRSSRYGPLHRAVVDAMTTNETSFFRDQHPFEALRTEVLPPLIAQRAATKTLSIWSAACSTGQEPYTISMILEEHFPQCADWKIQILATDLSMDVLERAKTGRYSQLEMNRGLPAANMVKYFERDGTGWKIHEKVRRRIEFRELNLIGEWKSIPTMDIIFIRNVLIYFDQETKRSILGRMHDTLRKDGLLFLGAAETTLNLDLPFSKVQLAKTTCYKPAST